MKTINYPNGQKESNTTSFNNNTDKNMKKSRLGTAFEKAINESNAYYLEKGIASIYKKPTPIQVVKVDYPSRRQARITEGYYKTPSTTDYNGIYLGKYIDFEAKSIQALSFPFSKIYHHQITHLITVKKMGGIAFLLIEFMSISEVYILEIDKLASKYKEAQKGGRKSIPYEYFKKEGYKVNLGLNPMIDYLQVIKDFIINEKKQVTI